MLSPNGVTTILFDLDGTLRHNQPEGAEVFIGQAIALGLAVSPDDRRRGIRWEHYYWASSPELVADFKKYEGHSSDFWLNYGRRQLIALGAEKERAKELGAALAQYMDEHYKPASVIAEQAAGMLAQLKEAGFKLGVVSNRDKPFFEELDQLQISSYFDLLLAAGEVQSYKPEPGIFQAALERLGMGPAQAVYVGDNYFADVIGARNAGLRPVLYDPRGVYPDAGCEVIQSFGQLPGLLKESGSTRITRI